MARDVEKMKQIAIARKYSIR